VVGPSKQASKQANIHTHECNEVMLVWGSLKLAPIIVQLAKSTVYSLHWHLSDIQNNYSSKNWCTDICSGKFCCIEALQLQCLAWPLGQRLNPIT